MKLCVQCQGSGKTKAINLSLSPPNQFTFTDITTGQETQCNMCLGNGYMNAFGAS